MTTVLKTVTNVYKLTARFFFVFLTGLLEIQTDLLEIQKKSSGKKCINKLNVLYLNCSGIKSQLRNHEFSELINSFDNVCFVETKTDDFDVIDFPRFLFTAEDI